MAIRFSPTAHLLCTLLLFFGASTLLACGDDATDPPANDEDFGFTDVADRGRPDAAEEDVESDTADAGQDAVDDADDQAEEPDTPAEDADQGTDDGATEDVADGADAADVADAADLQDMGTDVDDLGDAEGDVEPDLVDTGGDVPGDVAHDAVDLDTFDSGISDTAVYLAIGALEEEFRKANLEIMIQNPTAVGGFKFTLAGLDFDDTEPVFGGRAGEEGFKYSIDYGIGQILAYSGVEPAVLTANTLGVLFQVRFDTPVGVDEVCITNLVVNDREGDIIESQAGPCYCFVEVCE